MDPSCTIAFPSLVDPSEVSALVGEPETVVSGQHSFALYPVEVSVKLNGTSWKVYKRFSQFLDLHSALSSRFSFLYSASQSATLDPSIFELLTGRSPAERQATLQRFCGDLLSCAPEIVFSDLVCAFFRLPITPLSPPLPSESTVLNDPSSSEKSSNSLLSNQLVSLFGTLEFQTIVASSLPTLSVTETQDLVRELVVAIRDSLRALLVLDWLCERHVSIADCLRFSSDTVDLEDSYISRFIVSPTLAHSRSAAFRIVHLASSRRGDCAVGKILNENSIAISQYSAWARKRAALIASTTTSSTKINQSAAMSAATDYLRGPESPSARSVGGGGGFSPTYATALNAARDWILMSLFDSPSSLAGWRRVEPPKQQLQAKCDVWYKFLGTEFEVRVEIQFPPSTDMANVIALFDSTPASSSAAVAAWYSSIVHGAVRSSSGGCGWKCEFQDIRSATPSCVSCDVLVAADPVDPLLGQSLVVVTTDPFAVAVSRSGGRTISHLHYVGFQTDVNKGTLTCTSLLSCESIFLVTADLLGEHGPLWTCIHNIITLSE